MTRRFDALASSCDHNAIFSLTYLRVTEEYRRTVEAPFFDDTPFVNHEDTVFARYYFAAFDAWTGGRTAEVPPAWRVAFDAAQSRAVSATGDLLLGINAHVQRDLPLVLYAPASFGRTARAGSPTTTASTSSSTASPTTSSPRSRGASTRPSTTRTCRRASTTPPSSRRSRVAREGLAECRAARGGPDAEGAGARRRCDRGRRRDGGARDRGVDGATGSLGRERPRRVLRRARRGRLREGRAENGAILMVGLVDGGFVVARIGAVSPAWRSPRSVLAQSMARTPFAVARTGRFAATWRHGRCFLNPRWFDFRPGAPIPGGLRATARPRISSTADAR